MSSSTMTRTMATSAETRISTGIPNLDEMLEGGYPVGSLITISGRPGTGKTIFGSQFLHNGATVHRQAGMYVSMLEGRKAYLRNMNRLGYDFGALEEKGLFKFLEMPTLTAQALPVVWEEVVRNIEKLHIERIVIDSYTAMAQSFESQGDLRVFTHTLLGRIVGATGCTTLMIAERALAESHVGFGVEEFIADGVIQFFLLPVAGDARIRYLEVTKMRGTNHQMGPIPIEIGRAGIEVRHPHIRGTI